MSNISANLQDVLNKVKFQAIKFERLKKDVQLIAVSKKQPAERIQEMLNCGHRLYGENRVQEAQKRWKNIQAKYLDLKLHLIGPLQTNKTKDAVELFDVIETIDRPKLIDAVSEEMKAQDKRLKFFIQVNTGEEEQKSGIRPDGLKELLTYARDKDLDVIGLMCIPPLNEPASLHFAFLQKLAKEHNLKELSMGMSGDYERAIAFGATYVRVGSALFGERVN